MRNNLLVTILFLASSSIILSQDLTPQLLSEMLSKIDVYAVLEDTLGFSNYYSKACEYHSDQKICSLNIRRNC